MTKRQNRSVESPVTLAEQRAMKRQLRRLEDDYQHTGNPLYVWRAIMLVGGTPVELPGWVQMYLRRVSENMIRLCLNPPRSGVAAAAGRAAGFLPCGEDERGTPIDGLEVFRLQFEEPHRYRQLVQGTRVEGGWLPEKSGPFNPFRHFLDDLDRTLAAAVSARVQTFGDSLPDAKRWTAERFKVHPKKVERAWKRTDPIDGDK